MVFPGGHSSLFGRSALDIQPIHSRPLELAPASSTETYLDEHLLSSFGDELPPAYQSFGSCASSFWPLSGRQTDLPMGDFLGGERKRHARLPEVLPQVPHGTACGISETVPPTLPLPPQTLDCMKRAGRARVEYLWNYVGGTPNGSPPKPADIVVPSARYVVPPSAPRCQDIGCLSRLLREDMTEAQVTSALGFQPNMVTMETCGQQSSHGSWQCKIYRFGGLRVLFRDEDGTWVVNSWFAN
jgi:hypothetical protein